MIKKKGAKISFLIMLIIALSFITSFSVNADSFFDLHISIKAEYQGEAIQSHTKIPYGSNVRVHIDISNQQGNLTSKVKLIPKESMEFLSYQNSEAQINGVLLSANEYQQLLNDGYSLALGSTPTTIALNVKSTGSTRSKMSADIKVSSTSISNRNSYEIFEMPIHGDFKSKETGPQNAYRIALYDDALSLIDAFEVTHNEVFTLPTFTRYGSTFVGFNTKPDGTGKYFIRGTVNKATNFYAVYSTNKYKVTYYINGSVYMVDYVNHGEDAQNIIPSTKESEGNNFLRWEGNLNAVDSDRDVFAVFEKKATFRTGIDYYMYMMERGSGRHNADGGDSYKPDINLFFDALIGKMQTSNEFVKILFSTIPLMLILGGWSMYFYKKRYGRKIS
ncbi:hypothetical protein M2475_000594 [Breznakia sp. PF5-3]|uniref:InlB B-repeat-containing protein n=1 Tax=unclassified Breznakia TaxID=2623764 RepID=UPI00240556CD|nr:MULTISPECIES: InlB B-repeat-containing protein [unclassified Breznakia]MDF9824236.1 hypothetical protein [Breznakia sp. PM6-1]MDF9835034.1 hypothetical protein [Breznakia sp. PF5-3]MDF9837279.1 hypothetical protein [Breznakia sp. PFB2-8]MDF9859269.1 hypothetical protein [Breznakia sp. PH5-24]